MNAPTHARSSQTEVALWFSVLGGPIAWALRFVLAYALVPVACRQGSTALLWVVSAAGFLLALMAAGAATFAARRIGHADDAVNERQRWMARVGLGLSVLFAFLIVAESLALVFLDPCLEVELSWRPALHGSGVFIAGFARVLVGQLPNVANAHVISPMPTPEEAFRTWSFDPFLGLALLAASATYARGALRAWRRAGRGRGVVRGQIVVFACGVLVLALALFSPIDTLGALLFSAHMTQHLLLVAVAAPLFAVATPERALVWALPRATVRGFFSWWRGASWRRALLRAGAGGGAAVVLHLLALWSWHVPRMYEAALQHEGLHALEHASFFLTALLFWRWVVRCGRQPRTQAGFALLGVFLTAAASGLLGALITLAPSNWYPPHAAGTPGWPFDALQDQQLAGFLMWIPGGLGYLVATLWLASRWVRATGAASEPAALRIPALPGAAD